jgi:hypothetical protein
VHKNVKLDVSRSWRSFYVDSVFVMEAGSVTCYITDKRVVFIRCPDPSKAGAYQMTPYGAAEGIAKTYKARRILEAGGYEYFELYLDDIRFYKMRGYRVNLFVTGDGDRLRATAWTAHAKPPLRTPLVSMLISRGVPPK